MKKIFIVLAVAMVTVGASAQKLEYGVKAGLNMSSVSDMPKVEGGDWKMRTGFHAGAFAEYTVNDFMGVQAELLYSQQGLMMKAKQGNAKNTMKGDYLNLPVFAKFYVMEGLSVNVGPQFGYMMSLKSKTTGAGEANGEEDLLKGDHSYERFDVAAALGVSYKLACGVDVSARYNLGLTKLDKKMVDENDKKLAPKNNVIAVSVGYRF